MLRWTHAQESKKASREKAKAVVAEFRAMKVKEATKTTEDDVGEALLATTFPQSIGRWSV